jgi:uncharacterized protein YccT (UPF0319 family)
MKTVTALLASFAVWAGAASASEPIDVMVVTAKKPASMLSDMTDEILDETSAALKADQPVIVVEKVRIELPTIASSHEHG